MPLDAILVTKEQQAAINLGTVGIVRHEGGAVGDAAAEDAVRLGLLSLCGAPSGVTSSRG